MKSSADSMGIESPFSGPSPVMKPTSSSKSIFFEGPKVGFSSEGALL